MSATVYSEPYKLPAGILAVLVHSLFFALLYFGFNWNRQILSNPAINVELWSSLPDKVEVAPVRPKTAEVEQPQPPEKIMKPDIVVEDRKKLEAKPEKRPQVQKADKAKEAAKKAEQIKDARRLADEQAASQQAERIKQEEQAAADGRVVDEYKAKIMNKIRRNIVMPPDVEKDARAEFLVTLLPGGSVLPPKLVKSSGNTAYDNAVERAILKSDPLPLPPDVQLFNRFRELDMIFKPETGAE